MVDLWHQQDTGGGSTDPHTVGIVCGCQHFVQVVPVYININLKVRKFFNSIW